ncbi:MAG: hypothetical protein U0414_32290 [Polyangiaceae bacterium]
MMNDIRPRPRLHLVGAAALAIALAVLAAACGPQVRTASCDNDNQCSQGRSCVDHSCVDAPVPPS